ncbi:MAG: hypothetical protein K6C94_00975 [Candidatus Gastranaerophilales bacterium]|nr:hypothetical protein [Candidatus Gastranaerophilales bacterium]
MHISSWFLSRNALVLQEFEIDEEKNRIVHIKARNSGFFSWLLSLCGVDTTTNFDVYRDKIEYTNSSLSGKIKTVMPLSSISISQTGFCKPFIYIFFALFFMFLWLLSIIYFINFHYEHQSFVLWSEFLVGLFFIFAYFFNKTLLISVVSNSSWSANICFKRSIIEGISIDENKAYRVIEIINDLFLSQTVKETKNEEISLKQTKWLKKYID